jgi:alpha-glucosidase
MRRSLAATLPFVAVLLVTGCTTTKNPTPIGSTQSLRSPDRRLAVTVSTTPTLTYSLSLNGVPVLSPSPLGLQFTDFTVGPDSQIIRAELTRHDSTWTTRLYKRETVRDHYNQLLLTLNHKASPTQTFQVALRLYNDGLAFRYLLPANSTGNSQLATLTKELTQFVFPTDATCYAGSQLSGYAGSQEWEYHPTHVAALPTTRPTGLPLLVQTPRAHLAITESDLLDYPGLWLSPSKDAPPRPPSGTKMSGGSVPIPALPKEPLTQKPVTLHAHPAPLLQKGAPAPLARLTLPHQSPWRVVMVAGDPGQLIESDLVINLATPSKVPDSSWVKPGMMAWDHWWHGGVKMNTATLKQYIQLAADMGWPYQLVDWQWYGPYNKPEADITSPNRDVDMPELLRFAKERNVKLWLWLHYADASRNDAYKKAFPLYAKWGVAGVKIDFMDRDDQDMVNWYEAVCVEAARHKLMVNFHGAYKPTGLNRTYPNQLTREGILGNEYNRWSKRVTPEHRLTLPFTRFLAGAADYTPGGFNNRQPAQFKVNNKNTEVQSTRAAELALFVAYDSPITCAADHPDNYANQPGTDFLKVVPTTWKETRVLTAAVAEHLAIVRQSHDGDFYLGALTNSSARTLEIPLTFLPRGQYTVTLWQDAPDAADNPSHLATSTRTVTNKDTLTLPLAPAGGAVARFHAE